MENPSSFGSRKTPTMARRFSLAAIVVLLAVPCRAGAQGVVTEAEVIRLARSRSPASAVANATVSLADAGERSAGLLPNPSLSWAREAVLTGPAGSEDVVSVTVPIDVTRPFAARALAASQAAWVRAEASMVRSAAVLDALLAYYDAVLAVARVQVLARAVANLEEAARVLVEREAAGSASGYESTRLAVASELSRSHLAEARGDAQSVKARLAVLLGVSPESLNVAGSLSLASESPVSEVLVPGSRGAGTSETALTRPGVTRLESLRYSRASERFAAEARRRSDWAWLPTLELSGGVKHVSELGGGYGYVAGVSLHIPLFDHGQALRAEAEARRTLASARTEALARGIGAEVQSALVVYHAARQELARFESRSSGPVEVLLSAARSGYREGERSIVELLDAQRAETDVAERRLALLHAAKRAEARLRAAAGELQ